MQAVASQKAFVSGAVARPVARRSVTVRAAARPQAEKKQQNAAMIALAGFAAAVLVSSAAPAMAAEDKVKSAVCASNPTSKICLKDSAKN